MSKFGGLSKVYKDLPYDVVKKQVWDAKYAEKFPNISFDEEFKKIGGVLPSEKKTVKK